MRELQYEYKVHEFWCKIRVDKHSEFTQSEGAHRQSKQKHWRETKSGHKQHKGAEWTQIRIDKNKVNY